MTKKGCLLVMILDIHPLLAEHGGTVEHYLNSCLSFANLHIASDAKNRLAVIAANHIETRFLYPCEEIKLVRRQVDSRLELLGHIDECFTSEIKKLSCSGNIINAESLIAGALCRALLYIKRQENEDALNEKINARILIIKSSIDTGGQYLNYINAYLTAQKMNTPIDVCVIGSECGLLQQGADITGGYYQVIEEIESLLQTLLILYQADLPTRKKFNLPLPDSVDYRAACFCHRTLIDMGNVCSNCLSVYCKTVPFCATCNAFFQSEMPFKKPIKRKR